MNAAQMIGGLASGASLFVMAAGLTLIFGVGRIVNFAHGAFVMVGSYIAWSIAQHFSSSLGASLFGLVGSFVVMAILGTLVEVVVLKPIYKRAQLMPLLVTFGVALAVQDMTRLIWGADDLLIPADRYLSGSIVVGGARIPVTDVVTISIAGMIGSAIWWLLHRTRAGLLVRATSENPETAAILGVNQRRIRTVVFAAATGLAGLSGALEVLRGRPASLSIEQSVLTLAFVIVVAGGLGSVLGTAVAAVLLGVLNTFLIMHWPTASLVLPVLLMGTVLVVRPQGLFGRAIAEVSETQSHHEDKRGIVPKGWRWCLATVAGVMIIGFASGEYGSLLATDVLIFGIYVAGLDLVVREAGVMTFGQALYFGLGAYGTALAVHVFQWPFSAAIFAGCVLSLIGAFTLGYIATRRVGVAGAMLSLALAELIWAITFQWNAVTGGDNGVSGIWPTGALARPRPFLLCIGIVSAIVLGVLAYLRGTVLGYAFRSVRDSSRRAAALGIDAGIVRWMATIVGGLVAGLAGTLYAFSRGTVDESVMAVSLSIQGLLMMLLGGRSANAGPLIGAGLLIVMQHELSVLSNYWHLVLGLLVLMQIIVMPKIAKAFGTRIPLRIRARRLS